MLDLERNMEGLRKLFGNKSRQKHEKTVKNKLKKNTAGQVLT